MLLGVVRDDLQVLLAYFALSQADADGFQRGNATVPGRGLYGIINLLIFSGVMSRVIKKIYNLVKRLSICLISFVKYIFLDLQQTTYQLLQCPTLSSTSSVIDLHVSANAIHSAKNMG